MNRDLSKRDSDFLGKTYAVSLIGLKFTFQKLRADREGSQFEMGLLNL